MLITRAKSVDFRSGSEARNTPSREHAEATPRVAVRHSNRWFLAASLQLAGVELSGPYHPVSGCTALATLDYKGARQREASYSRLRASAVRWYERPVFSGPLYRYGECMMSQATRLKTQLEKTRELSEGFLQACEVFF